METQKITAAAKKRFVQTMVAATCLVTFQAYLVAPIIPQLGADLGLHKQWLSFAIPSFAIPFGLSSFGFSIVVNHTNRQKTARALLAATALLLIVLSAVNSVPAFLIVRALIGLCSGGIVQFSMSMMSDLFRQPERRRPFSWLILAHAAGMTFGPTAGAWFYPAMGWRWQFVAIACWALLIMLYNAQNRIDMPVAIATKPDTKSVWHKCKALLTSNDGRKIYPFIYLNGIFHAGLFVWISFYFHTRFNLDTQTTGLALLLFSLPGLLLAVSIGLAIKKWGSVRVLLGGLFTVSLTIIILLLKSTFWFTIGAVALLSIGYVMALPFYAGIIDVIRNRNARGLALGLGFGLLFLGYGTGPLLFIYLLNFGIAPALATLAAIQILLIFFARGIPGTEATPISRFKQRNTNGRLTSTNHRPEISG